MNRKDVLLVLVGFALVGFALAGLVNAAGTELRASYSSVSLSASRTASVFVYASNPDSSAKTISFSAESASGMLELYFDAYDDSLPARGSRGATLRVAAPETMRGCDLVTIKARVCSASGSCETLSKTMRVSVAAARESRVYVETPIDYCVDYYSAPREARGTRVASRLEFAGYFDATEYDAVFVARSGASGAQSCERIRPGEYARFSMALRNVGAASSYEIRLLGDKDVLNADASASFVSLERSEIAEFSVRVSPSAYAPGGRYHVVVQAQRRGVVVAERDLCVEVEQSYGVRLSAPAEVEALTCKITSFNALVENVGTGRDSFSIDVSEPDWALVATRSVEARAGQKQVFEVKIDGSRLEAPGVYRLGLKASSNGNPESREASSKAFVVVRASNCAPAKTSGGVPIAPQASVEAQPKNELVELFVNVENSNDEAIDNVSVALTGLPASWSYSAESGFAVPAHSNKTVKVIVTRATDEEASGVVLQIKSGDAVVGVQEIPKIESRASGLSGFFVAAGANTWVIVLIILVALAVVVLAGRANTVSERKQRDVYADRLELLKNRLESEASSGEVGGSLNALVDGESGVVGAQSQKNGRKPKQPVSAS